MHTGYQVFSICMCYVCVLTTILCVMLPLLIARYYGVFIAGDPRINPQFVNDASTVDAIHFP